MSIYFMQNNSLGNMSLWVWEFPTVVMISIFECRIKIGFKIRHSVRPENHYHFAYRTFCIRNDKQHQNVIYKKKLFSVRTRIIKVTKKWPQEIRHSKFCEDSYTAIQEVKKKTFKVKFELYQKVKLKVEKVLPSKKSNFELDLIIRNDIFFIFLTSLGMSEVDTL